MLTIHIEKKSDSQVAIECDFNSNCEMKLKGVVVMDISTKANMPDLMNKYS